MNGWEVFNADNTAQVLKIGEDTSFHADNLTYFVDLSDLSCWKVAVGTENGGIALGDFYEENGSCNAESIPTAYVGYNRPTFSGT